MFRKIFRRLDHWLSQPYQNYLVLSRDDYDAHPAIERWQYASQEAITFNIPHHSGKLFDWIADIQGTQTYPTPFILRIDNGQIHGRHALLTTADNQIIAESLFNYVPLLEDYSAGRVHYPQSLAELGRQLFDTPHFSNVFVVANRFDNAFYHWMIETLPRLWLLRAYEQATDEQIPIVVSPNLPEYAKQTLAWLGLDPILEWKHTFATSKTLYAPMAINHIGVPSPQMLKPISEHFKTQISDPKPSFAPRIYINRQGASKRKVVNYDDVMAVLRPYGFVSYQLETLSLAEQIMLFDQAEIVIGPHGAGFSNCIHSQNIKMIEFFEPSYTNICFYCLASGYGFDYGYLIGQTVDHNIDVDLEQLQLLLEEMDITLS